MYRDSHLTEMVECLEKILKYTPFSPTDTILNCLDTFRMVSQQYGETFDTHAFSKLPEWQNIVLMVMTNSVKSQENYRAKDSKKRAHILLYNTDDPGVGGLAQYNHTILCHLASLGSAI